MPRITRHRRMAPGRIAGAVISAAIAATMAPHTALAGATASYAAPSATSGISGTAAYLTFSVSTGTEWWYVTLAAPTGQQLQSGTTYSGAQRAPFRTGTAPGLDVYGDGRGCNQVYGQFTITSIGVDGSGNVNLLDATFTQNCEQPTAPALSGVARYAVPVGSTTSTALSSSPRAAPVGTCEGARNCQ